MKFHALRVKSKPTWLKVIQGAVIGVICALIALALSHAGLLDSLEYKTWDAWRLGLMKKPGPQSDQIRLIFLDQRSLDWGKQQNNLSWPWPRETYALVANFCRRAGARTVGMDMLFTEPAADDALFGSAVAASTGFAATVFISDANAGSVTNWPTGVRMPPPIPCVITPDAAELHSRLVVHSATFPVPEIATNAAMLVNVSANPDSDGIYRRIRPVSFFDGHPLPLLGLGLFLADKHDRSLLIRRNQGRSPYALQIGDRSIPLDAHGNIILNYRGPSMTHRTVNVQRVIESEVDCLEGRPPRIALDFFKNKYVLFGVTAPALFDLRSAPVAAVYPGVEIHATVLDNILARDPFRDAPAWWTFLLTIVMAVAASIAVRFCRNTWQTVVIFAIFIPLPFLLGIAAFLKLVWLPEVVLWVACLPALVATLALNYTTEGRQKRFLKGAFRQYLSPTFIDQLMQNPDRLKLGGEKRELTIFFSDIQGFTGISEKLGAEKLTGLLNEYLTAMSDIIQNSGGTVDKYIGDAVVAFWNAPVDQPDHAIRGVRAALECQRVLAAIRPELETSFGAKIFARIGVNTGEVVIGNMGSNQRFNYTFLGDAGNLASRLEGMNKKFGSYCAISQYTKDRLGDVFKGRELSRITVVGRLEPVTIYEPVSDEEFLRRREEFTIFESALKLYYAGQFAQAIAVLQPLAANDPTSAIYIHRCEELIAKPPTEWNGVWQMTEK